MEEGVEERININNLEEMKKIKVKIVKKIKGDIELNQKKKMVELEIGIKILVMKMIMKIFEMNIVRK